MFGNFKVRTRLLIMFILMLAVMAVITVFALINEKSSLIEDRKIKTLHLVEVASKIVEHYYDLQQKGVMQEDDAKKTAIETVKALRYGNNDYFWINDFEPRIVMHPTKPELDGQDVSSMKDPDGKLLFVEFVKTVQKDGAGYVFYLWPKPGYDKPVPKVSYVKGFAPWGWVIGSGIYIDDVNDIYWGRVRWLVLINLAGAGLTLVVMYFIGRSITRPIEAMDQAITRIGSNSDLSVRISINDGCELGAMASHLNQTLEQVGGSMHQVLDVAGQVATNAEQLAATTFELSVSSNSQASASAEVAAAVEEVTVSIGEVAKNAQAAEAFSEESATLVVKGGEMVVSAAAEMSRTSEMVSESARRITELSEDSKQISGIAHVIGEIANQTNLLALNAAIEAARAGESGRGFAVVADEVRKLAERTSTATAEISALIDSIQNNTSNAVSSMEASTAQAQKGTSLANEAGEAFLQISTSSHRTAERVRDIASSSQEQNAASQSIAKNVEHIAQMTEENSAATATVSDSANNLKKLADTLMRSVSQFKV